MPPPPPPLPLSLTEVQATLAPRDRARPLPARTYTDPAVFAFEEAAILASTWRCVGREDDLEKPGSWHLSPVTPEGILVVRGPDLKARAFYNVCRHRAAMLLQGESGRVARITCPYHGWTYELDGALAHAPCMPASFDRRAHGLSQVRLEIFQGFLFVNLDLGAAPLIASALAGAPPWIARGLPKLARARSVAYDVRANWKLLAENFQESHHFTSVHPALERLTPNNEASSVLSDGLWLGGIMDIAPPAETVSASGRHQGRPLLMPSAERGEPRRVFDALLFPTLLTSLQPDYLLTYRLHPESHARTAVIADTYVHPAAMSNPEGLADIFGFWDEVNAQDKAICERQQVGIGSRGYRPSAYARNEDGVHAFDRLVARFYHEALADKSAESEAP